MVDEPGPLLNVLPIMKNSQLGEFEYVLTHSMQHQNASIVFLEIKYLNQDENIGHVIPQLLLEIGPKITL